MLNSAIVRITQIIALLFFTATVMVYAAGLLLVPLAVLKLLITLLSPIVGGVLATIVSIPALIWLGYRVYKVPGLVDVVLDAGWSLVKLGADVFRRLDALAKTSKNQSTAANV